MNVFSLGLKVARVTQSSTVLGSELQTGVVGPGERLEQRWSRC